MQLSTTIALCHLLGLLPVLGRLPGLEGAEIAAAFGLRQRAGKAGGDLLLGVPGGPAVEW